jgi:hypothetical protein
MKASIFDKCWLINDYCILTLIFFFTIATKLHNHIFKYIYFVKNKVWKRLIKKM